MEQTQHPQVITSREQAFFECHLNEEMIFISGPQIPEPQCCLHVSSADGSCGSTPFSSDFVLDFDFGSNNGKKSFMIEPWTCLRGRHSPRDTV